MNETLLTVLLIIGWLIAAVEFLLLKNLKKQPKWLPPILDIGHIGFELDPEARKVFIEVLKLAGITPSLRFEIGPTDQTLMSDKRFVLNLMNHNYPDPTAHFSGDFISLDVDDPAHAAAEAAEIIGSIDKDVETAFLPIPGKMGIYPVYSKRIGKTITFRLKAMKLGMPPGQKPI